MAALQDRPRCHAPTHCSLLVLLCCGNTADNHKTYLRSLPGCIFMTSNNFMRTVSRSCSLMLHNKEISVGSALDRFDSKRHSLMFSTFRSMQYRLVDLEIGKAPSTLAVFPVPVGTSATPPNPLQPAQRLQPPCQAPRATSENVQPFRTSSTDLTALLVTSVAGCVSTCMHLASCSYVTMRLTINFMNSFVELTGYIAITDAVQCGES